MKSYIAMRHGLKLGWVLLVALLTACATTDPSMHAEQSAPEVVSSWEEGCEDEQALVLLCREENGECGFFRCREVVPREVLLASRGGGGIPAASSAASPRRWWRGGLRWPRDTAPVLTFRFNRHFDPKPPQLVLPPGRYVRHHIFPQARDLQEWFIARGVKDIHQFTLVIPEYVHLRIHSGGPSGGRWNEAWRSFREANFNARPEQIYRHAGELLYRFELVGSVVPYYRGR
ncbi:TIGR02269 family lipoprotein [Archangium sp.]|uniref:SitA6 family polymorphic toxin lipoprotein n=1 Tax=Archangium sp. TaxID=1872627 RepID=UPI002ED82ECB